MTQNRMDVETVLADPLSLPEGGELDAVAALQDGEDGKPGDQIDQAANPAMPKNVQGTDAEIPVHPVNQGELSATPGAEGENDLSDDNNIPKDKEAVVLSRDGKHEIPYDVLRAEREKRARAELMAQELTARLQTLEEEVRSGHVGKSRDISDIVDSKLLDDLRDESPMVAEMIDKLIAKNQAMAQHYEQQQLEGRGALVEQRVKQVVETEDAIAAVPKLSYLRVNDPERFAEVATIDTALMQQTSWKGRPLAERFNAALKMYEVANGDIVLPGAQPKIAPVQQPTVDAKVKAAIAKAQQAASGPSTLSDIPGGMTAPASEQDALGNMSGSSLTQKMMDMSPEELEAMLARLG